MKLNHILLILVGLFTLTFTSCGLVEEIESTIDELEEIDPRILSCDYFNSGTDRVLIDHDDRDVDYIIDCVIPVNVDLIIEPGVVIEFREGTGMVIGESGSIVAAGTTEKPILFTCETKIAGAWRGMLNYSNDVKNTLSHFIMEYGGGEEFNSNGNRGNLIMWAETRMKIDNSTFAHSASYGIDLRYGDIEIASFTSNTISNSETPITLYAANVHMVDATNTFAENKNNYVEIGSSDTKSGDYTWHKLTIPYRIIPTNFGISRQIKVSGQTNLTIEPGTVMEFDTDTGLRVEDGGGLRAVGTPMQPILFTGIDGQPAAWKGLYFSFTQSTFNKVEHAIIEYTGSSDDKAAIYMWATPRLEVSNTTFRAFEGCAFSTQNNPNLSASSNTIEASMGNMYCD